MYKSWVILDHIVGHQRQSVALAAAMHLEPQVFTLALHKPWRWLAPCGVAMAHHVLPVDLVHAAKHSPPLLVIGCGRTAALATAWLKKTTGCFVVQILNPKANLSQWDMIVTPQHDQLQGKHIITTLGALHSITQTKLAQAKTHFIELAVLPEPRIAILIGGSSREHKVDRAYLQSMLDILKQWHQRMGGSFMITTSRRTPDPIVKALPHLFADYPHKIWHDCSGGENPYMGFLAYANYIIVTPDSVNMISEACAVGKPVFVHQIKPIYSKFGEFLYALKQQNRIHTLTDTLIKWPGIWADTPLQEVSIIAGKVWQYMATQVPEVAQELKKH